MLSYMEARRGKREFQILNLINIYGPNVDNSSFFKRLFLTVSWSEFILLWGDFYRTFDPVMDRSTQKDTTHV